MKIGLIEGNTINHLRCRYLVFLSSWLLLPLAVAGAPQTVPAPAASTPLPAALVARTPTEKMCVGDLFYEPLPGQANYCQGLKDWYAGHYRSALEMMKLAAGWGNKNAQYTLGLIYLGGRHVPADIPLGLAWLKLANERDNDEQISRVADSAFKWALPSQRERAQQLYDQMLGTYGDRVAAARAWHHLRHWQRSHSHLDAGCVRLVGPEAEAARRMGLVSAAPQAIHALVDVPPGGAQGSPREVQKERARRSNMRSGVCVRLQTRHKVTRELAATYFQGFMGSVSVGPLKRVPADASSSSH